MLIDRNADGSPVVSMAVSPDGRHVAACFRDRATRVWSLEREALAYAFVNPFDGGDNILSIAWFPDSIRILSGSDGATGTIWLMRGRIDESISPQRTLRGHSDDVCAVSISPDGAIAVTGSIDGLVQLWDMKGSQRPVPITGLGGRITCIRFSPNGKYLAVAAGATARIYNQIPPNAL